MLTVELSAGSSFMGLCNLIVEAFTAQFEGSYIIVELKRLENATLDHNYLVHQHKLFARQASFAMLFFFPPPIFDEIFF